MRSFIKKFQRNRQKKQEKQTRYLSQAIQLEEAVNPHIIKATMIMVSLALLTFIVWSGFTNINEIARTPGEVVPHNFQQTVQHLEGGIVRQINVKDGAVVQKGDILILMNDSAITEDYERAQSKQLYLEKQVERLRAFIEGRELDFSKIPGASREMITDQRSFFEGMRKAREQEELVISNQIAQKRQAIRSLESDLDIIQDNLKIIEDIYQRRVRLNEKGFASDMQLLSDEREINKTVGEMRKIESQLIVAQKEVTEFEDRLASLSAGHIDEANEKLDLMISERDQNKELIQKLEERMGRMKIRAPTNGLVQGLAVNTIGAVVMPGETIMEIVPLDEALEVSVKISPQDIGHLKPGQTVQVKFSTYDFSRYGSVAGKLDHISATTFAGEQGDRYYQGRVLLDQNYVGSNPGNIIMPGMTVMADIITGEKTILQYMLKPIHTSLRTAFTER